MCNTIQEYVRAYRYIMHHYENKPYGSITNVGVLTCSRHIQEIYIYTLKNKICHKRLPMYINNL